MTNTGREFMGRAALGEATQTLLEDSQLALVIVRGGGFTADHIPENFRQLPAFVYKHLPEMSDVDQAVRTWWESNTIEGFKLSPRIRSVHGADRGISAHLDKPLYAGSLEGPVTFSARIDTNAASSRLFYAKTLGETLLANGVINRSRLNMLDGQARELAFEELEQAGYTHFDQEPGDIVLFRNFPSPTLHAVETEFRQTKALVGTYFLRSLSAKRSLLR